MTPLAPQLRAASRRGSVTFQAKPTAGMGPVAKQSHAVSTLWLGRFCPSARLGSSASTTVFIRMEPYMQWRGIPQYGRLGERMARMTWENKQGKSRERAHHVPGSSAVSPVVVTRARGKRGNSGQLEVEGGIPNPRGLTWGKLKVSVSLTLTDTRPVPGASSPLVRPQGWPPPLKVRIPQTFRPSLVRVGKRGQKSSVWFT